MSDPAGKIRGVDPGSEEMQRWYQAASVRRRELGNGIAHMLDVLDAQRARTKVLAIGSGVLIAILIGVFYVVLSG